MAGHDDFASAYALAVAAARAKQADVRGQDITSFLDVDAALNLAAVSLPTLQRDGSLQGGSDELAQQVALLRYLVCLDVGVALPLHPELGSAKLLPALAPLVKVDVATGRVEPQPLLERLLAAGASAAAAASAAEDAGSGSGGGKAPGGGAAALPPELKSAELFAKLLTLAMLNKQMQAPSNSLQLLDLVGHALDDSAARAAIATQLDALEKLCAFGGGAQEAQLQGWRAPTSAQLRAVFHVLNWQVVIDALGDEALAKSMEGELEAAMELSALALLQARGAALPGCQGQDPPAAGKLQPDNPRSSFYTAWAALVNRNSVHKRSSLVDPLPHVQRGLELARQQKSAFWEAKCGWLAAYAAAACLDDRVGPQAAQVAVGAADAALARSKGLLPPHWVGDLKREREGSMQLVLPLINEHLKRGSPDTWHRDISQLRMPAEALEKGKAA